MAARHVRPRSPRFALFGLGVLLASALSCGREITAPLGGMAGQVSLQPVFAGLRLAGQSAPVSVSGLVDFVRVRIILLRTNGDTAVNRVVEFPADSQSISLTIPITLSADAPAEGETLSAALRFVNATGDTVFTGGPIPVQARPTGAPPTEPPAIPITYTGPGATAASITLSADTVSGRRGETKPLTATVRDAQGTPLPNVPVAYSSLDTAMATVGLTSGTVAFKGIRGQTRIVVQTLTGQADTAVVLVLPTPSAIAFLPEATGQQTRQRDPFPKPALVKVTAADGLPVAGAVVDFVVVRGKGSASQAKDTTDAAGLASVVWTAGDSVGTAELSARIGGGTLEASLTGVQLNAGPTTLRFLTPPSNVVAQDPMATVAVVVLDAIQDTVRTFTGPVRLTLGGGRAGAVLSGTSTVNAIAGVARFTDLAVDRDGTGYTLSASLDSTLAVPAITSPSFTVTPRPIGAIALVSGAGQQALFGTPFAQPVIFQVRGLAGEAIRDAIVTFAATGGGTLSQSQDTSDVLGRVSVTWTAGSTPGEVTLTATALGTTIAGVAVNRQGSPAPSALEFLTQPAAIAAGDTLPRIRVRVLNGLGAPIPDYVGTASVALVGGTSGAVLVNAPTTPVPFAGGIAEFGALTVDRAGGGYRLSTQVTGTTIVALSDSFPVAPAPPAVLTLVSGGGQTVPERLTLPDSIVVQVKDRFGFAVSGATVAFGVVQGGGTVSPTSRTTTALGRASTAWTAGAEGPQRLAITAPGVDTLFVSATALASNGAPILFAAVTDLSAPVGRATPVKLFLSNPAPIPIPVTLSMSQPRIARWSTTTATIPVGGTTLDLQVLGDSIGAVHAIASSPVGVDTVSVVVDSTSLRFVSSYVTAYVSDTVRTRITLDLPAPAGGLALTIVSRDSARVKVAAGDGRGYQDEPVAGGCLYCEVIRSDAPSVLGPIGGTATISIPAGEMVGHLVLIPVDSTLASGYAEVGVRGAGIPEQTLRVTAIPPRFDRIGTGPANEVLGVGQYSSGWIDLEGWDIALRRDLPVRIRPLTATDSARVTVLDTLVVLPRGTTSVTVPRMVEGKAAGIAFLLATAPGFAPDTIGLRVDPAVLFTPYTYASPTSIVIGEASKERIAFGSESPTEGKTWGARRRETTRLTITVVDTTILSAPPTLDVLGTVDLAEVPLTGRRTGRTTVTFAAPGYVSHTMEYEVVGGTYEVYLPPALGVTLSDEVVIARSGAPLTKAIPWSVTAVDTGVVRVLTPAVLMSAGGYGGGSATVRIEGRGLGTTTLTFAGDGQTLTRAITITRDALVFGGSGLAGIVEADSIERELLVFAGSGRPFAAPVEGRLRSSDPTKVLVTDSILRFRPDSLYAVARVRAIGTTPPANPVVLTLSAPDFTASTAGVAPAPAKLHVLPVDGYGIAAPPSGPVRVGRGLAIPLYVQRWTPTTVALPLTFTRRGTAGISVAGTEISIAAGEESRLVRLRGGAVLGTDTLVVSAPGLLADTLIVEVVPLEVTIATGVTLAVEQRAEVSGWTAARIGESYPILQRVGDSTLVRLVSLDTTLVRVEQDTLLFVPQADGAVRLARVRGIAPGIARLRVLRLGTTDTLAALEVQVERPRLLHPLFDGDLVLGMQQRTEGGEVYVERSHPSRRGLWVHLRSSAPRVATVPDSVLIPPDSTAVHFRVTAGDSVGGARITMGADRHAGASFPVTVTRARLAALVVAPGAAIDEISTSVPSDIGVFALTPVNVSAPSLRADGGEAALFDYFLGGYLRPSTVPIPVRLRVADAGRVTVTQDTTTIPAGEAVMKISALTGVSVGTTSLTVEDRRGETFASLLATTSTLKVTAPTLAFRTTEAVVQVPFLGALAANLWVESRSSAASVVARLRVLPTGGVTGIGIGADSLLLTPRSVSDPEWTPESGYPCYDGYYGCFPKAPIPLRGLALGTHRIVAEAPGHRPDTISIEVTGAQIVGPSLPGSLAVGDSVRVDLTFASATGSPITLGNTAVQLTIATGTALQATAPTPLTSVVTGGYHSCGLTPAGSARCWGYNLYGQALGNGTTSMNVTTPTAAAPSFTFVQLAAGFASTCGRTASGAIYCWGDGSLGALGNGGTLISSTPVKVATDSLFTSLVAGYNHYCGLTANGTALCWGRNNLGQLGRGTTSTSGESLPDIAGGSLRFTALFSSYEHTCGIGTDGKGYCWGDNNSGKLGDSTMVSRSTPTPIASPLAFVEFATGLNHTCARTVSGAASCWGNPWKGALGNGTTSGMVLTPQPVSGSLTFASIASGADHVCGTLAGGTAYCWGRNDLGQGGNGTTLTDVTTPTAVAGGLAFASLDPGTDHSCGRLTDGTTRCWGYNQYGQVGAGALGANQLTPLAVTTGGATTALLVPANGTGATFWLKGIAPGTATVTVSTPNFASFSAALTVR